MYTVFKPNTKLAGCSKSEKLYEFEQYDNQRQEYLCQKREDRAKETGRKKWLESQG
jgi:hypothetical protein